MTSAVPPLAEELLSRSQVARLATVSSAGRPHVVPVWFVWHDGRIYIASVVSSLKSRHAADTGEAALVVDEGQQTSHIRDGTLLLRWLRGAEVRGEIAITAPDEPELPDVARRWAEKYLEGAATEGFRQDTLGNHHWLRLTPRRFALWDHHRD